MLPRPTICLLGGTGFLGQHLAARLVQRNYNVKILTRSRTRHHEDLGVLMTVALVEANVYDADTLAREFNGCAAVVNLVGILNERGHRGRGFRRAHVELAQKVLQACRAAGVTRLLHMSALNAATRAPSHYLRSKAEAAELVLAAEDLRVTVFEPGVMFGPGDKFLNRFARFLRLAPGVFPLPCPRAKLAPVYAGDVAEAVVRSLDDPACFGRRYCLCGPKVYTLRELLRYLRRLTGHHRLILGWPRPLSWLQAAVMEWLPGKPFSLDNYHSLRVDNVCRDNGFTAFGLEPLSVEAVLPTYLGRFTAQAELNKYRRMRGMAP